MYPEYRDCETQISQLCAIYRLSESIQLINIFVSKYDVQKTLIFCLKSISLFRKINPFFVAKILTLTLKMFCLCMKL